MIARLSILSWIRGFHVYKDWWTPCFGDELALEREPENPKDKNAISVLKDNRVVGHIPLGLANTKDGAGLVKHFLSKQGTTGDVKVHGMVWRYHVNIFNGPKNLMECLESLLNFPQMQQ